VARDKALSAWEFGQGAAVAGPWGSGYPGDPITKKFLQAQCPRYSLLPYIELYGDSYTSTALYLYIAVKF
jgi:hypothetical protein